MGHVELEALAALALDPADGSEADRRHVAGCQDCSAARRSLQDVRRLAGAEPLVGPPAHVRQQVLDEALVERALDPPPALATARAGRVRGRGIPAWAAGLAATVALVAGLGLGRLTVDAPEPPAQADPGTVVAAADLTALDSDSPRGVASALRTDDMLTLQVSATELSARPGIHEVWLINLDGERMVALGFLAPGVDGEFDVPIGLIEQGYRIVDISVEPDDGDPTHSGVSLARGELA